jgi:hypothetical protein
MSGAARAEEDPRVEANRVRHFALNLNPLAIMIGRFSADLQVLPFAHHALVVTPFAIAMGSATPIPSRSDQRQTGYGGELGYHFYGGTRGPNGFFAGGGAILQSNQFGDSSATSAGGFLDVGVQGILDTGWLFGCGAGLQYLREYQGGHAWSVQPRALAMVGYAF